MPKAQEHAHPHPRPPRKPDPSACDAPFQYRYYEVPRPLVPRHPTPPNENVLALLFLLAASGTHAPSTTATRPVPKATTACAAVTRADVEFALGRAVGKGSPDTASAASTCDYARDRGQVTISIQHLDAPLDLPAEFAALQREIEDATPRQGPHLGDHAFFLDIAGAGTQLHVIRGRDYLLISVLGFGEGAAVSQAAEKMARAALGRM